MNQKYKDLTNLKGQLEQEYQDLSHEYKVCSVLIESKVQQKDILARQVVITKELTLVDEELNRCQRENEKNKESLKPSHEQKK